MAGSPGSWSRGQVTARRLWLPWQPRLRLIMAYRRLIAYVYAWLNRFDVWIGRRFTGWLKTLVTAVIFLPYLAAWLVGFTIVCCITLAAFAASVYLVSAEWLLLALAFPVVLAARMATSMPWPLIALAGRRRWTARVAGWSASGQAASAAVAALTAGTDPITPPWSPGRSAARIWT
jgi:hypothetical protein